MPLHPTSYGHVDLPARDDFRPPRGRPDGIRVARRPKAQPELRP